MSTSSLRFLPIAVLVLAMTHASAFTVKRNVNAAEPLKTEVVIFDKNSDNSHLKLIPNGKNCTMDYNAEGAIEIHMTSNTGAAPEIRWEPSEDLPETFNAQDYNYLIMRCQFSGNVTRTFPNGRQTATEPPNPWFVTTLLDINGERTSSLNLATISPGSAVPREMIDLKIPMTLYLQTAYNDPTQLNAIAFKIGKTHNYNELDYTFTIERIELAN